MPKFVPRQRKHKVLAREKAAANAVHTYDPNAEELTPLDAAKKRELAEAKAALLVKGTKVSSKKAKRLEKYIEKKLRKDESRMLIQKLGESKIDTSLFAKTSAIGQAKETKRQTLQRALQEEKAGIQNGDSKTILYQEREEVDVSEAPEVKKVLESDEPTRKRKKSKGRGGKPNTEEEEDKEMVDAKPESDPEATCEDIPEVPETAPAVVSVGSGLKRPLETDDDGRPVLKKRQKRGGVATKHSLIYAKPQVVEENEDDDEFEGFDDEDDESDSLEEGSEIEEDDEEDDDEEDDEEGEEEDSSDEEEDEDSDDGDSSEIDQEENKQRSSSFRAWALQQRNEALGFKPSTEASYLEFPTVQGFVPRAPESDPLPRELQPTTNLERKVYSVTVSRPEAIQEARMKLPVVAEEQRIMEAIHNNDIVVVCGATGSGKTTQIPQFLFESGYGSPESPTPGMIGITQPRRVAAVSMAKRVGEELAEYGARVGYQIRFDGTVDSKTAVKFMTDGVLLREVAQDITLAKYSAIVVDEAHERSVNTDILVGMLSRVAKLRRELADEDKTGATKPLKLVIMSATLRVDDLIKNPVLFPTPPPVLEVEGRQHPVTLHFSRRTHADYVEEAFKKVSRAHRKLPPGGILVFLTGQNEIAELSKKLKAQFDSGASSGSAPKVKVLASEAVLEAEDIDLGDADMSEMIDDMVYDSEDEEGEDGDEDEFKIEDDDEDAPPKMKVLPLYSLLPTREQLRVFEPVPEGTRLVILATNVAETSLTIPGIRYVFDTGRAKERRFDRLSGVQSFDIGWISKASASQRAGRAGRTGPGHCYRLYSSAVFERDFDAFSQPEILRMPIEGVVLQLKAMKLHNVVNFPFPTAPSRPMLAQAERLLEYLSALTAEGSKITPLGTTMSMFPLSPRFARILLVGHLHDCMPYTISMIAALSVGDVFIPESHVVPQEPEANADGVVFNDGRDDERTALRKKFNAAHHRFCHLDERSDAIKLLQVLGEFAHVPTEAWARDHFVRYKALAEATQLRKQIVSLLQKYIPAFANLRVADKLPPPSEKQVTALKQMVAVGFVDQIAIRADLSPTPPEMRRKPRRAIDVPYVPLVPLNDGPSGANNADPLDSMVYLHPSSPMAHLSVAECPEYVVYGHLQRGAAVAIGSDKMPKTRMHSLTDITGAQLATIAKGTPLLSWGKPVKEVGTPTATEREVWVVPYLRAEGTGGQGWPLPIRKVKQKKVAGKGWVVL
ncbi:putative ATP-dependent RNA helicase PB1A10.06c [Ceratocystis platani]|uniref:RNA helicase n=1 Tax=Ceratocystis fimbriata f. sp. platani TaxID=88771 RepID=A0A0F8DLY2_CERFI|nr:putative ATP-dependent RNA helicase PB1A10.06c [Ceratocystis platani]